MVPVMSGCCLDCLTLCGIPENCVEFLGKIDNSFLPQKCTQNYQSAQCCLLKYFMSKNPELHTVNQNFIYLIHLAKNALSRCFTESLDVTLALYCPSVLQVQRGLSEELNRLYTMFTQRNPYFISRGGKVSVIAHSLGCVIVYDIVTGWRPDSWQVNK